MATTMKEVSILSILLLLLLPFLPHLVSYVERQVYIVYFGEHNGKRTLHEIEETHHSYLLSVKKSKEEARSSLVYSYKNNINGFAAVLTQDEASKLFAMDQVVSVFKSHPKKYSLQTTRSWEFAGLEVGKPWNQMRKGDLLLRAKYGKDIIVGVIDTGVWPESKSFSDEGLGPIPKSWKGICQTGESFNSSHCNKKIIGARYYLKGYEQYYGPLNTTLDYKSPRDKNGHGTHTASTVGGRRVSNVSALGGFARGTASGGASLVHLAIYKVCWAIPDEEGEVACMEEDILAAIDDAIVDGVDVLSLSLGTKNHFPYAKDGLAIGALHATKKNIVVSCSAGNNGPTPSTLSNPAPWIITVGASSVDRAFVAPLELGNGIVIEGQTLTPYKLKKKTYPLVYAAQVVAPNVPKNYVAGQCLPGSLSSAKAKGKIVLCLRGNGTRIEKGVEVKRAGGVGFVLGNTPLIGGSMIVADANVLPATAVDSNNALKILNYINSTKKPTAYINPARTIIHRKPAPFMANFTSRGPNTITPDILKPDITAPGINILAAWTEASPPTTEKGDHHIVKYKIISGTSMSCPHVAAVAALLKAIHPTWSSAAIRSAIITSADSINNEGKLLTDAFGNSANPFQFGSGHFRPIKAADPGLIYDASYKDYLLFLCSNGVKGLEPSFKCPKVFPASNNLNYPSLAIAKLNGTVTVKRTVTNVGEHKSVYFSSVKPPLGFSVSVHPPILTFNYIGQKKSFTITVKARSQTLSLSNKDQYSFGWFTWVDGVHNVRSPIAVSLA